MARRKPLVIDDQTMPWISWQPLSVHNRAGNDGHARRESLPPLSVLPIHEYVTLFGSGTVLPHYSLDFMAESNIMIMMKTLVIECPDQIHERLDQLKQDGWIKDPAQTALEALSRFLDAHYPDLQKSHIMADVDWGLRGHD